MPHSTMDDPPFISTFLLELPFDAQLQEGATVLAWEREDDIEVSIFDFPPANPGIDVDTRFVFRRSSGELARPRTVALGVFDDFWEGTQFVDSVPAREETGRAAP